ncbi:uncharacterized protein DMENIID0001_154590 [Sergentomyia squamirostris]
MVFFGLFVKNVQKIPGKCVSAHTIHMGSYLLAGHSKWANIRHIKAAKDGQKSLLFSRFTRQIRLAVQEGKSPNPAMNHLLKSTIDVALKKQMPMASIQAAIKKASGQSGDFRRHVLEVKVVQGKVYVILVFYTDLVTQTRMNIATILRKSGGSFADLKHLFTETGLIVATRTEEMPLERLLEEATEHAIMIGAEDVEVLDENGKLLNFSCYPTELSRIRRELQELKYEVESAEHVYIPETLVELNPEEKALYTKFRARLDTIEGLDEIYDNIDDSTS